MALLDVGLEGLLKLLESFLVVKETLQFGLKFCRENSLVILSVHDLHIDSVVKISEKTMSGFHLLFGDILRVLWRLLLLNLISTFFLNRFEYFEE